MSTEQPNAERIMGISSMAMRDVLLQLGEAYEQRTRLRVALLSVGGVDAARRVQDGEAFDFVVLAREAIDRLAAAGRVEPDSRTDLARSGVAIAVAGGAPRPDISSESALCDAIVHARTIGYSTGPSGAHIARLLARWGIAEAMAPRIVQPPPGVPIGALVASGEVELGFQQRSELMHVAGVDVVGGLPPEIQSMTVFSAAVCSVSTRGEAAKALLSFLASPAADATKLTHCMQPV
jgi:molybdate transport system substrate-binding protein